MDATVIDGDISVDYELTWGCLNGWGGEGGRWKIHLFTRDGVLEFESSDPGSATAVDKAKEILRAENGLQNPNVFVGIESGRLVLQPANPVTIKPRYEFDQNEHSGLAHWQKNANLLAYLFGSHDNLIKSIKMLQASGIEILSESTCITLDEQVTLSWNVRLDAESIDALCVIFASGVDYEWDSVGWLKMRKHFSGSIGKLLELEFRLGPSPHGGESFNFGPFDLVSHEALFFSQPFLELFIYPAWATARIGRGFRPGPTCCSQPPVA